jgi:hypothetical protein
MSDNALRLDPARLGLSLGVRFSPRSPRFGLYGQQTAPAQRVLTPNPATARHLSRSATVRRRVMKM